MNFNRLSSVLLGFLGLINVLAMKFEEAETQLTKGVTKCPELSYNWGLRAYVRIRLGDFEGAISDCTRKILLKPNDASTYALRGWAHYCRESYSLVIEDLEQSIALEPSRKTNYQDSLRLIDAYLFSDQDEKVICFCDEILASPQEDFFALELYARKSASLMKLEEYESCLVALDKALLNATLADKAELHKMKAEVFEILKDFDARDRELDLEQNFRKFEAQITEWMPAGAFKRAFAGILDASISSLFTTSLFVLFLAIYFYFGSGFDFGALQFSDELALLMVPYAFFYFFLGFLDSLLVFPALFVSSFLVIALVFESFNGSVASTRDCQLFFLLMLLMISSTNFFYHSYLSAYAPKGTPGKCLMKIRVTDFDGGALTPRRLCRRHFIKIVPSFIFSVVAVVCLSFLIQGADIFQILVVSLAFTITSIFTFRLCFHPGLHNLWTNSFVSDVNLYFGGPLKPPGHENPEI